MSDTLGSLKLLVKDLVIVSNKCTRFLLAEAPQSRGVAPSIELLSPDDKSLPSSHAPELATTNKAARAIIARHPETSEKVGSWPREAVVINAKNIKCIEWALTKSFAKLSASAGRIALRAFLGAFVLTRYLRSTNEPGQPDLRSSEVFWGMIRQDPVQGKLLKLYV